MDKLPDTKEYRLRFALRFATLKLTTYHSIVHQFRRPKPGHTWNEIRQSRFGILILLFCVTGFLGLPLLWTSRAFSKIEKWIWSIINVIYTSTLIYITARIVMWAWGQFTDAF